MDKPVVIRYSEEETDPKDEVKDQMVNQVVSYFTHTDPEGHTKKWKKSKKAMVRTDEAHYYYV
jgi:hypothetical protein